MSEPNCTASVNDVLHASNLDSGGYFSPETPSNSRPDGAGFPIFTDSQGGGPFERQAHSTGTAQDPDDPEAGGIPSGVPAHICDHGPFCAACRERLDRWLAGHPGTDVRAALELDEWREGKHP